MRSAPQPASRRRLALRLIGRRNARCVGPTSAISLLRTSTRASLVLPASSACAPVPWRRSPVTRQCDSLRRACTDLPYGSSLISSRGRFLPIAMRARLTSAIPVASPIGPVTLARARTLGSRQGRLQTARVNERPEKRPGMTSVLRRPSPRDALSDTRLEPTPAPWLCHHGTGCRRLCYPGSSCEHHGLGSPSTRPVATGPASLNLGVVRRLLQPNSTRGHTLRAVDPASRNLHTPAFTVAFHLRGQGRSRAGALEKGERALLTIARALLVEPRASGSPVRLSSRPGRPGSSAHRPRLFLDATSRKVAPSRESRCLPSR